jgi:ATP-dependent helicase HrpB
LSEIDPLSQLAAARRRMLDNDAPARLALPDGRHAKLNYEEDGRVTVAVRLQSAWGLSETPRLGPNRVPVTFSLLAPSGRPVQVTADLRSFWSDAYLKLRPQLRARYPKHKWP